LQVGPYAVPGSALHDAATLHAATIRKHPYVLRSASCVCCGAVSTWACECMTPRKSYKHHTAHSLTCTLIAPGGCAVGGAHNGGLPAHARGRAQVVRAYHHHRHGRRLAHERAAVLQPPEQVGRLVACASRPARVREVKLPKQDTQDCGIALTPATLTCRRPPVSSGGPRSKSEQDWVPQITPKTHSAPGPAAAVALAMHASKHIFRLTTLFGAERRAPPTARTDVEYLPK